MNRHSKIINSVNASMKIENLFPSNTAIEIGTKFLTNEITEEDAIRLIKKHHNISEEQGMRYHSRQTFEENIKRPRTEQELRVQCPECACTLTFYDSKKLYNGSSIKDCEAIDLQCQRCKSIVKINMKK